MRLARHWVWTGRPHLRPQAAAAAAHQKQQQSEHETSRQPRAGQTGGRIPGRVSNIPGRSSRGDAEAFPGEHCEEAFASRVPSKNSQLAFA
eukprot:307110-Chlamydomonas_euryale.AAC.1